MASVTRETPMSCLDIMVCIGRTNIFLSLTLPDISVAQFAPHSNKCMIFLLLPMWSLHLVSMLV